MTPRAQGQEKVNSVPCPRHAPSEHTSSTLPGGVSNPLYQGCRLHPQHPAPPTAPGSTHCTWFHPARATYRSSFREPVVPDAPKPRSVPPTLPQEIGRVPQGLIHKASLYLDVNRHGQLVICRDTALLLSAFPHPPFLHYSFWIN